MGLFRFFKHLSAQVKCDKVQTEKNNWIFLNNKMQHLIQDKGVFVEENQLCIFRSKNKICDVLKVGNYEVCQQDLPLLFDRNNINRKQLKLNNKNKKNKKKKEKKIKVSCDVYFAKEHGINYVLSFKHKHTINNVKVVEKIKADITFNILNVQQLSKFLFLEIATVSTNKFYSLLNKEFSNFIYKEISNFKGEIMDLEDEDISHAIRYKFVHEFGNYGLDITNFVFKEYQDITKRKQPKKAKTVVKEQKETYEQNNAEQDENLNNNTEEFDNQKSNEQNNIDETNQNNNTNNTQNNFATDKLFSPENSMQENQTKQVNESYKEILQNGKIIIDPNDNI